jgi:phosphoglycolate phosphatase
MRIFEKMTGRAEPLSEEDIAHFRGLNAFQVVRELRIRPWRLPWLMVRGRALMRREIDTVVVFKGTEEVLQQLKDAGIPIYIMSSNSPGNIRRLMEARKLDHYFTHIYGNVGIFGKAKRLRQIIDRNDLDKSQVVYVGDEGRDIEAAKHVGIKSVAVGWGFNSPELLARHHPTFLVRTPAELAQALLDK